ncbi:MAG: hypothetical protein IJX87_01835 [Clostridia bacterium]|nr:hypothetical protein [Clostridia bacterium]
MLPFILLTLLSIATAIVSIAYIPYLLKKTEKEMEKYDLKTGKQTSFEWANTCYMLVSLICGIISIACVLLNIYVVIGEKPWGSWIIGGFIIIGGITIQVILQKLFNDLAIKYQIKNNINHQIKGFMTAFSIGGALYNIIYFIHCLSLGLF